MTGVTRLHDVVHVVCGRYPTIRRFSATTYQRLRDFNNSDVCFFGDVSDIVACERTSQLYVADCRGPLIWQASANGTDLTPSLPPAPCRFRPWTLSLKGNRLLVTSARQLLQYDANGRCEFLGRVPLPDYVDARHAVESPTGTFVVSHHNTQLKHRHPGQVSEVNADGQVLHQFSGSLGSSFPHIAVDSRGNIFVADSDNGRVLLLDAQLALRRVIINAYQLNDKKPQRLCYTKRSGQLLVGLDFYGHVAVFDVLYR